MTPTIQDAAVRAAVTVAARFGLATEEPVVLADGANIVVHLRPAPVVAKVAASTPAVRRDNQHWLQRELDVSAFLTAELDPAAPQQALHGDAGGGNLMATDRLALARLRGHLLRAGSLGPGRLHREPVPGRAARSGRLPRAR